MTGLSPGFTEKNLERVAAKINFGDCWEWVACVNSKGYGRVTINGHSQYAHRAVYRMLVGEPPDGMDLDHLCRRRNCVNPDHLEPVTRSENLRRGILHVHLEKARKARWDKYRSGGCDTVTGSSS